MKRHGSEDPRAAVGVALLCCFLMFLSGALCSEKGQNVLNQDDVVLAETIGTNGIYFHRNTTEVDSLRGLIIDKIKLAVESISKVVEVENVNFRAMVFPERTIPCKGMSGAATNGRIEQQRSLTPHQIIRQRGCGAASILHIVAKNVLCGQ